MATERSEIPPDVVLNDMPINQVVDAAADLLKAPFPYMGGKATIAPVIWTVLGDINHYIEPFCGSAVVTLQRPNYDPARHVETINDADGMIANVWRAIQHDPDAVAKWCDWPVSHIDLIARKAALNAAYAELVARMTADDTYYDTKLAGYYIWAASCWIGNGLVRPGQRPRLSRAGTGVHAKGQRPHLSHAGMGVQEPYSTNLYAWFRQLSERLRYVRTICGDWRRVCGGNWQKGPGRPVGIFFDPPYGKVANRDPGCYTEDSQDVAQEVQGWCRGRASDPDYRIVLAGYYDEHKNLLDEGWRMHRWSAGGGYGGTARSGSKTQGQINRHKETLFFSPHCLPLARLKQGELFDGSQDCSATGESTDAGQGGQGRGVFG